MRILHVNKFLRSVGGAETYMFSVAAMQREAGHLTEFFGMENPDNAPVVGAQLGDQLSLATSVALDSVPVGVSGKVHTATAMIWNRDAQRAMEATVERFEPDVVHLHNIYHQLSPSILRPLRKRRIATVMTVHDYKLVCPNYKLLSHGELCVQCVEGGFHHAAKQRCQDGSLAQSALLSIETRLHRSLKSYDPVNLFLCPSKFMASQLDAGGVFPARIRHLPNFVSPASSAHPDTSEAPIALFVGRLSQEKGTDVLVDAAALMEDRVQVVVIGDGPEADALKGRVEATNSPARLIGRKTQEEVREWIRRASVLVVPSRWHENQPISILEALSQQVPVVSTDLGGLPELVIDGQTGVTVPANDAEALAAAIEKVAGDPAIVRRMGMAGAELVERHHSPMVHERGLMALYDEALRLATV